MNSITKISKGTLLALAIGVSILSCDKINHPGLGDYPKDANQPGGPLKFYTAFDGINADSIRANYASVDSVTTYDATGASGQAIQFNPIIGSSGADSVFSFLQYASANDFAATATSFTVSFWISCPLSKKDTINADGIMALSSTSNFWGNITVYADHTTGGHSDSMDLKFHFANGAGDNWDFANYVGAARWPHMYDGNWHQVVFSYDATAKTATLYRDGVQFDQKTNETIVFDGNASNLILGGFEQAANIQGSYSANTWMNGWPGALDNVKFYTEALSATDIAAAYGAKN